MADGVPIPGAGEQPPAGVSSISGPTPNRGYEAAGLQKLGLALKILTDALPMLGATSEPGQAVLKAISGLSKLVPPGSVTPAAERNNLESMMMRNQQSNQQLAAVKQLMAGGGAGAAGGAAAAPPAARAP